MTRILRTLAARLRDERGMALVMALGISMRAGDRGSVARPLQRHERASRDALALGPPRLQHRADRASRTRSRRSPRRPTPTATALSTTTTRRSSRRCRPRARRRRSAAGEQVVWDAQLWDDRPNPSVLYVPSGNPYYIPNLRWHVVSTSTVPNPAAPGATITRRLESDVLLVPGEGAAGQLRRVALHLLEGRRRQLPVERARHIRPGGLRHHPAEQPERRRLLLRHRRPLPGEQQPDHRQRRADPDRRDRARLGLQRLAAGVGRHAVGPDQLERRGSAASACTATAARSGRPTNRRARRSAAGSRSTSSPTRSTTRPTIAAADRGLRRLVRGRQPGPEQPVRSGALVGHACRHST